MSPQDADHLDIKFAGEIYWKSVTIEITGKILDKSNGTEDGILNLLIKNGSQKH